MTATASGVARGQWRRLGLLGNPAGSTDWAVTHAALPVVDRVAPGEWNLYVSSRDADGRGRIGRCRMRLAPTPALSPLEPEPVLDLGTLGAFDDNGVTISSIVTAGGAKYLYYTGWSLGVTVPFYLFVGLAISRDGGQTFARVSDAPVLPRGPGDPYLTASPSVLVDEGVWRMWYVSGSRWERVESGVRHYYNIRYSESRDGVQWQRPARIAIDYGHPGEHAFGRPCVVRDADAYRMWYCHRGDRYRIGGAESADGMTWRRRDDDMGFTASGSGWESEMVAYPWIFDWQDRRYMLYNGNDYGRTGIGLAQWEL
jgi:hypothetical protein